MSQTLTKPVLLDETGQEIVEKLDDIKEAIGVGGDFTPVMIKVTTPPAKIAYMAGEPLDLAGIVVSLIAANGVHIDVTDQCTFNPANGTTLTSADTSVAISYYWYKDDVTFTTSLAIGVKQLASIAITTPPTETEYTVGETLDLTGIVVVATYDDSTFLDVTSRCTYSPADGATLAESDTNVTVTYSEGGITKTATQAISVTYPMYGAEWDGTATTKWTRTDLAANFGDPVPYYVNMTETPSSPFDNIQPWAGMSIVNDSTVGKLVSIPKFYYKLTQDGAKLKIQIANEEIDGFSVSPAHMDRGDGEGERDVVYVGRYHCANATYKSTTGVAPMNNTTRSNFRTAIHNLGADIWQWDFALWFTIWLLYLVEYADWDSQKCIGYGANELSSSASGYNGQTDSMPYHTGTDFQKETYGGSVQYRYIENLWSFGYDWLDGCRNYNNDFRVILNPLYFDDYDNDNEISVGTVTDGMTKKMGVKDVSGIFPLFVPIESGGSSTTYITDSWYMATGNAKTNIYVGASVASNLSYLMYGLFAARAVDRTTNNPHTSSRLMKLPANS